jgi:hypothetical protein
MNRFIQLFKGVLKKDVKTPLGRWNHGNYSHAKLKTNYANEDHCGSCAEYIVQKRNIEETKMINKANDELYQYMIGYDGVPDSSITNIRK